MATSFPTSLDALVNPLSTDTLDSVTVPHDLQHTNANDAIEALEAKVGINGSLDTNSLDYKVAHLPSATITIQNKTTAYTVVAGDLATIINCTSGTFTVSLTAAATLGAGFNCWIWNTSTTASNIITIDPATTETIEGKTTITLQRNEGCQIVCDGTNWKTVSQKEIVGYAENLALAQTRPSATGDLSIAIGNGALSSGATSNSFGYDSQATNANGTSIGSNSGSNGSRTATGNGAMALGGSYASGTDSFAAAIANNTSTYGATGANSVAIGRMAKASASNAIAIGLSSVASGLYSAVLGGNGCHAEGGGSFAIGGGYTSNGAYALAASSGAIGDSAYVPTTLGKLALSCSDGGFGQGANQKGITNLRKQTTDATASILTSDAGVAGALNQVILPNNSAYTFTGTVISKQSGSTNVASWKVEGVIVRGTTAASTTLVASTVTAISNVPAWTLALSADTTNGGLAVTFTGATATNIRTVCTIETSEVVYA